MTAFTYELYSDAQGRFKYDGAALKLVERPMHLERVYADAGRGDARAKELVRELEHWFHQAGVAVADTTTRPACLPFPELTPECQPNWQFLKEFLGDTREAGRLRQVVAHAYEVRARERGLQNKVIVAGINLLLAGGMAKGLMTQAAATEAREVMARPALVTGAKAVQVEARTADRGGGAEKKGAGAAAEVFNVTPDGVVLPKGPKHKILEGYVENPHRSGSWGEIVDGKFKERLRIDPPTPPGQKGPNTSHYHLDGKGKHYSPAPGDKDPGFQR